MLEKLSSIVPFETGSDWPRYDAWEHVVYIPDDCIDTPRRRFAVIHETAHALTVRGKKPSPLNISIPRGEALASAITWCVFQHLDDAEAQAYAEEHLRALDWMYTDSLNMLYDEAFDAIDQILIALGHDLDAEEIDALWESLLEPEHREPRPGSPSSGRHPGNAVIHPDDAWLATGRNTPPGVSVEARRRRSHRFIPAAAGNLAYQVKKNEMLHSH